MNLSIIIPALNEAEHIAQSLAPLQLLRERGVEVIVVDGGSADPTPSRAEPLVDRLVNSPKGRSLHVACCCVVHESSIAFDRHFDG